MNQNMEIISENNNEDTDMDSNDAYSMFVFGIRTQITRDYYLRRLKIFFNYIDFFVDKQSKKDVIFLRIKQ